MNFFVVSPIGVTTPKSSILPPSILSDLQDLSLSASSTPAIQVCSYLFSFIQLPAFSALVSWGFFFFFFPGAGSECEIVDLFECEGDFLSHEKWLRESESECPGKEYVS